MALFLFPFLHNYMDLTFFGFFQIKNFSKEYVKLRKLGKVAIGRKPGKFRSGTIVLFAIDNTGKILQAKKMQGVTVLARMKNLEGFEGKYLEGLTDQDLSDCNNLLKGAIKDAINNYEIISKGGSIEEKPSPLQNFIVESKKNISTKKLMRGDLYGWFCKICRGIYEHFSNRS